MKRSPACDKFVKSEEKCHLVPYLCPAKKWTVGWGQRIYGPIEGLTKTADGRWTGKITQEKADQLLSNALANSEIAVSELVKVAVVQHEFDALVSFVYNCGRENLAGSTLLKKLNGKKNGRRDIAAEFTRWVKDDDNQPLAGLQVRRALETAMFLGRLAT